MKMRNVKLLLVLTVILLVVSTVGYADQNSIQFFINEKQIQGIIQPGTIGDDLFLPSIEVTKALNAKIDVDAENSIVKLQVPWTLQTKLVRKYWEQTISDITLPPINGMDNFKDEVTEAFNLLNEKDSLVYLAAVTYIQSVNLKDVPENTVMLYYNDYRIDIDPDLYDRFKKDFKSADRIKILASILAHETAHAQINASGLRNNITKDDDELIALLAEYRAAQKLELYSDYIKERRQLVINYAKNLK